MKFILLNQALPPSERGEDGALGRLDADNVYIAIYASRPNGSKAFTEMLLGEEMQNVAFNLSGEKGLYTVRRVE